MKRKIRSIEWQKIRREADSDFEADVYNACQFLKEKSITPTKADRLTYTETHTYTADRLFDWFEDIGTNGKHGTAHHIIYIELKAAFNDRQDSLKYPWIKRMLDAEYPGDELVFLLKDPNIKKFGCKKLTMGQWCERHGFRWFTQETIHTLLEEKK